MPFPLAHPAAVLPLRRCWPSQLNFAALVVGSLSPDLAYCFGPLGLEGFSHTLAGTFGFCLPAGLLVLWFLRWLISWYNPSLATGQLVRFWPAPALAAVALSLLLGAWTHLLWDGFTHENGWFVQHFAVLRLPVTMFLGHQVRVFHVLWYGCSFAGVGWLYVVYERWRQRHAPSVRSVFSRLTRAAIVALTALLLAAMHHLSHYWLISYTAGFVGVLLVLGLALLLGKTRSEVP